MICQKCCYKWRPRKCRGLDVANLIIFVPKNVGKKIPLNHNVFLHFLKKKSPNLRKFTTKKQKLRRWSPSCCRFYGAVLAVLITAIVFRLLITAIVFALLTMVIVFLLWFLWRRLRITNYGDRFLALIFDFLLLHAEQGRTEEERRNFGSVFWFARFISWSLFLLSFVLQQLRECCL